MAGVTAKVLGVLTMGWPKHQARWHQMGLPFPREEGEPLLKSSRSHCQSFNQAVMGRGHNIRLVWARKLASFNHVLRTLSHPLKFLTVSYLQPNMIEVLLKIVNFLQVYENIQVGKRNV